MQKLPIVTALSTVEIKKVYGQSILDFYQQVTKFLVSSDATDELKHFFAEPAVNISRGEISWYTSLSGQPLVIGTLDDRQRNEIAEKLSDIFRRIEKIHGGISKEQGNNSNGAEAIRGMLATPDLMQSLFVVDGKLVLAEWGCVPFGSLPSRFDLIVPENRRLEAIPIIPAADAGGLPLVISSPLTPEAPADPASITNPKLETIASPQISVPLEESSQQQPHEVPVLPSKQRLLPFVLIGQALVLLLLLGLLIYGVLNRNGLSGDQEAINALKKEITQLWLDAEAKSKSCSPPKSISPAPDAAKPVPGDGPGGSAPVGPAPSPSVLPPDQVPRTPPTGASPDAGRPVTGEPAPGNNPGGSGPPKPGATNPSPPPPAEAPGTPPASANPDAVRPSAPSPTAPRNNPLDSPPVGPSSPGPGPTINDGQLNRTRPTLPGIGEVPREKPDTPTTPKYYRSGPSARSQELQVPGDTNDLSFLQGCWQSDRQMNETVTGAPLNAQACFPGTDGVGTFTYSFADGRRCEGPLRARRERREVVMEHADITCSDGAAFPSARIVCRPGTGAALCDIVEIINGIQEPLDERTRNTRFLRVMDESTERRLELHVAKRGRLEISLSWNTIDDLDLSVTCPDGAEINFQHNHACGGRLVLDMNTGSRVVANPVEHIIWDEVPNFAGSLRIGVTLFQLKGSSSSIVPYKVIVKLDNRVVKEYQSQLSASGRNREEADLTLPNRPAQRSTD